MPPAPGDSQQVTALRQCQYALCKRGTGVDWRKLKRCAACAGAWYCSKECQKAGWPLHKPLCQAKIEAEASHGAGYERFGFGSSAAFIQAVHDYVAAHKWAIHNAVTMHMLVKSGPDMTLARQMPPQEILRIRLVCQTTSRTPRANRNPASMFKIVDHGFISLALCARAGILDHCASIAEQCASYDANIRSRSDSVASDPLYVGVIPVMYLIDGTTLLHTGIFPVFRPPNNVKVSDKIKAFLQLLIRFCVYTTGTAFPLRAPDKDRKYYPVPGKLTRAKGMQWNWKALFTDWDDYCEGRADCERLPGMEELGLTPGHALPALLDLYAVFWITDAAELKRLNTRSQSLGRLDV